MLEAAAPKLLEPRKRAKMPKRLSSQHPGLVLLHEFMRPNGISAASLGNALHISRQRVHYLIAGKRAVTPDTALRLARFFNTTAKFWMELQIDFDLYQAEAVWKKVIDKEVQALDKRSAPHLESEQPSDLSGPASGEEDDGV